MVDERDVWAQIGEVMDPELDRPVDALGFVESVRIRGSEVVVHFRLPTYWCAPNFAYMMSLDLRERIGRLSGVETVTVRLLDHFAEDEITDGVNAGRTFSEVFAGETDGDLAQLRRTFLRKAFLVRQEQLLRGLMRAGFTAEQVARLVATDVRVEDGALLVRADACDACEVTDERAAWRQVPTLARTFALYRQKRAAAGLGALDAGPLFTTADGEPLTPESVTEHLRIARTIRLNGAFNTVLCTALNRITHGVEVDADTLCEETTG